LSTRHAPELDGQSADEDSTAAEALDLLVN
jgi:hypothetical protein